MKLVELPVFGHHPAYRAGDRPHHDGFRLNHVLAEFYATQHGAAGDAGGREKTVTPHHVVDFIFSFWVFNAHFERPLAQLLGIDDESCLHLTADASQGSGGQNSFGCAANAEINVDASLRFGAMNNAGHVAVANETDRGS